jgi:hypothetical protein
MVKCEECGKKLGLLNGYYHPALGKNNFLCSDCYNVVNESVEKWIDFISPYKTYFKNEETKNKEQVIWKNISNPLTQIKSFFNGTQIKQKI